jgi:hypothetical protein
MSSRANGAGTVLLLAAALLFVGGCRRSIQVTGQPRVSSADCPAYLGEGWDGEPGLEEIAGTGIVCLATFGGKSLGPEYDICRVGRKWYWPYKGKWFVAGNWRGPWQPAEAVPDAFLKIPEAHPRHRIAKLHPAYAKR